MPQLKIVLSEDLGKVDSFCWILHDGQKRKSFAGSTGKEKSEHLNDGLVAKKDFWKL